MNREVSMKNYDNVLFDLDGTLTDPGIGITNSVAYALKKYGIPVPDRAELYKFIGPPLVDSFMEYYGFSEAQAQQATSYFREYFAQGGLLENQVYDGIETMLQELRRRGKHLCIATSKPEPFAKTILEHFRLAPYFDHIFGASMDTSRNKKGQVIAYALEQCGIADCAKVVMVGDRRHDVLGAAEHGIDCIGVLFGYGDRVELEGAGAAYIAETVADIAAFIP